MATSGQLCQSVAEALGVPFATVREHLRNIRRTGEISFKGHGRGAAAMTTLDAARLLIAAAGSSFVKDSVETLAGFGKLRPIGPIKTMRGLFAPRLKFVTDLELNLAQMMQRLIDEKDRLPNAYRRPPQNPRPHECIALTLMSVVGAQPSAPSRVAITRFIDERDVTAVSFGPPKWATPVMDEAEYALRLQGAGLIQTRHVPAWTLAEIAHKLVADDET